MCGFNCSLTRADISQPRNTWGCPCGLGYWDEIKKEFVTGDSVRSGESQSRNQYLAHLEECSKCRTQAQLDGLDPISVDPNLQGYWMNEEGIDLGIFSENIKSYLGDNAFVLPGTNPKDGTIGYLIRANAAPTREMLSNLKYLTKQKFAIAQTSAPPPTAVDHRRRSSRHTEQSQQRKQSLRTPSYQSDFSTFKSEQNPTGTQPLRQGPYQSSTTANIATTSYSDSRFPQLTRSSQRTTFGSDPVSQSPSQVTLVPQTSPISSYQPQASNLLYQSPGIQSPNFPPLQDPAQVGGASAFGEQSMLFKSQGAQPIYSANPYQSTAPEHPGPQFYQQGQGFDSQAPERTYSTDSYQVPPPSVAAQQPHQQNLGLNPQKSSPSPLPTGYQSKTPSYQQSWTPSSQQPPFYSADSYQEPTPKSQPLQSHQWGPHVGQQQSSDDSQFIADEMENLGLDKPNVDIAQGERGDYDQRSGSGQPVPQHGTQRSQERHRRLPSSEQQSQHRRTSRTQDRHQRHSSSEQQKEEEQEAPSGRSQEPRGGARDRKGRDKYGRRN